MSSQSPPRDKRGSPRLAVDIMAEFRVEGSETVETGQLVDLSAGGFLFEIDHSLGPGTGLSVTLRSNESRMITAAWVLRCFPAGENFRVACAFD